MMNDLIVKKKTAVESFVKVIIENINAPDVLHITTSTFKIFGNPVGAHVVQITKIEEVAHNSCFDIVLGDLPLGMIQRTWGDVKNGATIRIQQNWLEILISLSLLKEKGTAIFLVEPHGLSTTQGPGVRTHLVNERVRTS